jgi:hypothetical protein
MEKLNISERLEELRKQILSTIEGSYEKDVPWIPSFVVVYGGNKAEWFAAPWETDADKDHAAMIVKKRAGEVDAEAIFFGSEAYTLKVEKKDLKKAMDGRVSDHPDKQESFIFTVETKEAKWMGVADILERDGKKYLGPWEWKEDPEATGRFCNLLPKNHKESLH